MIKNNGVRENDKNVKDWWVKLSFPLWLASKKSLQKMTYEIIAYTKRDIMEMDWIKWYDISSS